MLASLAYVARRNGKGLISLTTFRQAMKMKEILWITKQAARVHFGILLPMLTSGSGTGGEDMLSFFGKIVVLPLVIFLAGRAVFHEPLLPVCLILIGGVHLLLIHEMTTGYQPSNVANLQANPESGQQVRLYVLLLTLAGLFVLLVIDRRYKQRRVN